MCAVVVVFGGVIGLYCLALLVANILAANNDFQLY